MTPATLTVRDVAAVLCAHPETVREMCRRGELPAFRLGDGPRAQYRFRASEIDAFIASREAKVRRRLAG